MLLAGVSGSGKTTLAGRVGSILNIPQTEIDSLFHGPNWEPRADFADDVDRLSSAPAWITEWQYSTVRRLLAGRADTLIWLDFPVPVSMGRLIRRTVRRRMRREELWNGNQEPPLHTLFSDQDHIIRWGWRTRHKLRDLVPTLEGKFPGLCVVRLTSPAEVEQWLGILAADAAGPVTGDPVDRDQL